MIELLFSVAINCDKCKKREILILTESERNDLFLCQYHQRTKECLDNKINYYVNVFNQFLPSWFVYKKYDRGTIGYYACLRHYCPDCAKVFTIKEIIE